MTKLSQQLNYLSLQQEYDSQLANSPIWDKGHIETHTALSPCCNTPVEMASSTAICLKCGSDVQMEDLVLPDPEDLLLEEDEERLSYLNDIGDYS